MMPFHVAANDDELSTYEARNLANLLNKAADWTDQMNDRYRV